MSLSNLPRPVQAVLDALQARDGPAFRAALCAGAVLWEGDNDFRGDAISAWFDEEFARRTVTVRPVDEARRGREIIVTLSVDESDGRGAVEEVLREWCFTVEGERVSRARMSRREMPALPPPVAAYVRATNRYDLEALLSTFDENALVNDQLQEYWGKAAIREWAEREIIGVHLTMFVVSAVEHHGHVVVTAHVNGNIDRRGLPDPLVLTFYFSPAGNRIVQLIILRNQSGT